MYVNNTVLNCTQINSITHRATASRITTRKRRRAPHISDPPATSHTTAAAATTAATSATAATDDTVATAATAATAATTATAATSTIKTSQTHICIVQQYPHKR
jgi:hypothetical protein